MVRSAAFDHPADTEGRSLTTVSAVRFEGFDEDDEFSDDDLSDLPPGFLERFLAEDAAFDDDALDVDDEFRSPTPHPDDRLWRHPSEIAREAAQAASAATNDGPLRPHRPGTSRRRGRRGSVALASIGVTVLAIAVATSLAGGRDDQVQSATVIDPLPVADATGLFGGTSSSAPAAETTNILATQSLPATSGGSPAQWQNTPVGRSEAHWQDTIRDLVGPALPTIIATNGNEMREGRGVTISTDGLAMTSAAIVDGAESIVMWIGDDRYLGEVVAVDSLSDIAVVRMHPIDGTADFVVPNLISSSDMSVGQPLVVLHPTNPTVARVTSHRGQARTPSDNGLFDLVELDISPRLIPGTAVVSEFGDVVAFAPATSREETAAVVWPIEQALEIATALAAEGHVERSWLGALLDTPKDDGAATVATVKSVCSDSPAERAGLRNGDRIIEFDLSAALGATNSGLRVTRLGELVAIVRQLTPGTEVTLTIERQGDRHLRTVRLEQMPAAVAGN